MRYAVLGAWMTLGLACAEEERPPYAPSSGSFTSGSSNSRSDPLAECQQGEPGVHSGSVTIRERSDADVLSRIWCLRGDLTVRDSDLGSVPSVSSLEVVRGNVSVRSNENLDSVASLEAIDLITGSLSVTDNPALATCRAENLSMRIDEIRGSVTIRGNRQDMCSP